MSVPSSRSSVGLRGNQVVPQPLIVGGVLDGNSFVGRDEAMPGSSEKHSVAGPTPRPCASCPYRRDVPSGVWAVSEYEKLAAYDRDTADQPSALFMCHQNDGSSDQSRLCSGWVGCHGEELLALRLALMAGDIDGDTFTECVDYVSPTPLFESGRAAAQHGVAGIDAPSDDACAAIAKIRRRRSDLAD